MPTKICMDAPEILIQVGRMNQARPSAGDPAPSLQSAIVIIFIKDAESLNPQRPSNSKN